MDNNTKDEIVAKAERDTALDVAAQEAARRKLAEAQAVNASIVANQADAAARQAAAENRALRTELMMERDRSATNAFSAYLLLALVLAGLVIGGFWLYGRMDRSPNTVYAGTTPGGTVVVTQPGRR